MPDQDSVAGNARLLRGLIWAGVLLAPVAAAVVLLGQSSNTVRFAVLLIAVALVLIGASVLVRNDPVLGQMDLEERVAEEVATLRRELRAEFGGGRGAAQVHGGPPRGGRPPPMPASAAVATLRQQPPEEEPSSFFADLPAEGQYPDPFAGNYPEGSYPDDNNYAENNYPEDTYSGNEYADDGYSEDDYGPQPVQPMPPGPPPMGTARPAPTGGRAGVPNPVPAGGRAGVPGPVPAGGRAGVPGPVSAGGRAGVPAPVPTGGRAGVPAPVASAAVRPPARTGPGMTTGGRQIKPEPGMSSGGRPIAAAAAVPPPPQIPRQRGPVSASARPGNPYGPQLDSPADDFSNGYAAQAPGVYGSPASTNTYGSPAGTYGGGGNDFDSDEYNGYGAPSYGADYGPAPSADYGTPSHEPGGTTGDPNYKARRHRPSANDTNVGSLSDFASYGGYSPDPGHGRR